MISAVLPLLMGVVMYFLIGPLGAIFMLLSPVLLIGSAIEAKRTGQYEFKEALAEHKEVVDEQVQYLEGQRLEEIQGRFRELPAAGELGGLVRSLSDRLWERAPDDADFLRLRAGTAQLPSRIAGEGQRRGTRDLRKELEEIPGRFRLLDDVPLAPRRPGLQGVGVAGPLTATRALARSLIMQAVTMHSPTDLAVVALVGESGFAEWEFLKWLPHARSLGGAQLASTSHHALSLVNHLLQSRVTDAADTAAGDGRGRASIVLPAVLVLIDETCPLERRRLMPLLEAGPRAGVFFVWVSSARHRLPKACGAVVEIDPDHVIAANRLRRQWPHREPDPLGGHVPRRRCRRRPQPHARHRRHRPGERRQRDPEHGVVRRAPRRPARARRPGVDPRAVATARGEPGTAMACASSSACSPARPFVLDVRQDGPHALVAGTTGAGKSEFLQSLVAGLATMHSPERITFLLVDYKGGAAFKECVELPHTVGLVTDLDRNEVRRALISLNAELHHRELLLKKADAKDLLEMERKGHPETPPSLLIVVDEFAALAKEVPEFVDGVIDVALRGRSLGLHLVLATQRPAGVITGQIRANTNLRIALRMSSDDESDDVVGSPVAAAIERRLPGRAVARIGPQELVPFQSAYVGGHTMADVHAPNVNVRLFGFDHDTEVAERRRITVPADHPSDLQRLVVAQRGAFGLLGAPAPRRPWLPSLAPSYDLGRLPRSTDEGALVVGVADQPARQLQSLAYFHPDADGGLLILGTGGSGKTVALRTLAVSAGLAAETSAEPFEVHALDFAGRGLDVLEELPHVGSVISGDDTERVTRLLRTLRERIDQRAIDFAAVRASSLPEYRRNAPPGSFVSRVLVLLDSYPGFQAMHERIDGGKWLDLFTRLVADGRQVGVHFVITADRRSSIPMSVASALPRKVVLRLSNDDEYLNAGEPAGILSPRSPAGRAIIDGTEVQVAVLGGSANGERQAAEIGRLAARLTAAGVAAAPAVGVLPDEFRRSALDVAVDAGATDDRDRRPRPAAAGHPARPGCGARDRAATQRTHDGTGDDRPIGGGARDPAVPRPRPTDAVGPRPVLDQDRPRPVRRRRAGRQAGRGGPSSEPAHAGDRRRPRRPGRHRSRRRARRAAAARQGAPDHGRRRGGQHRRPPPVQRHDPGDAQGRHRRVAPAGHRYRRRPGRGHVAPPHPGRVAGGARLPRRTRHRRARPRRPARPVVSSAPLDVPELVRQRAMANGAAGRRWLDDLPEVVASCPTAGASSSSARSRGHGVVRCRPPPTAPAAPAC